MNGDLIKARIISFAYSASTLIVAAILAALASPEFHDIAIQNFGTGVLTTTALLVLDGVVKHARNIAAIKEATENLGSTEDVRDHIVLI